MREILFTINLLLQSGFKILELEENDKTVSYWLVKDFQTPVKNSVEDANFCVLHGVNITERLTTLNYSGQVEAHRKILTAVEGFLALPDVSDIRMKFSDSYRYKYYYI